MKTFVAELKGLTPSGHGKNPQEEPWPQARNDASAERTWPARAHVTAGEGSLPLMALRLLLDKTGPDRT